MSGRSLPGRRATTSGRVLSRNTSPSGRTRSRSARVGARWRRIPHAFLWPFYAIDYALAQVCALQYARWMDEDPKGAWRSYLTFCRASGTESFPQALRTAGLADIYAPDGLTGLMNWLQTRL